ncbi:MAG: DUF2851 family protein [Ferruginibacter sp.]
MTEKLLQYIWQFRHFNISGLVTVHGESLYIIHPGRLNSNQGPDFLESRIRIGNTEWAGNIELHIHASDWEQHRHSDDKNYLNIILHVVWKNDKELSLPFPTLELQPFVPGILLNRYEMLMHSTAFIPCHTGIARVPYLHFAAWKERLLTERLQQRSDHIMSQLNENVQHWEEVFWWLLARNFGIRINAGAFEAIARSIPLTILAKHKNQLHQVEALLLGQAAILDTAFKEAYPAMLRKEYNFLQKKYGLQKPHLPVYYLRMRPANFPTVRLAQLAMLIHRSIHLFAVVREAADLKEVTALFNIAAGEYWDDHYLPDHTTAHKKKNLGVQMMQNILINTIVPVLYAYGYYHSNRSMQEKALRWLEQIAPEHNSITKGFTALGIVNKNAFDSQALIQLRNEYCNEKKCLACAVGNWLLKAK